MNTASSLSGSWGGIKQTKNPHERQMHSEVLRYLRMGDDLEEQDTVSWMLKINQVGQFSIHNNRLNNNHLADVELNMELGKSQV